MANLYPSPILKRTKTSTSLKGLNKIASKKKTKTNTTYFQYDEISAKRIAEEEARSVFLMVMNEQRYDGRTPIGPFLDSFHVLKTSLMKMDTGFDPVMVRIMLQSALKDAENPPEIGIDGEQYIGPATWLSRQPLEEINTYDKLAEKLREKFSKKKKGKVTRLWKGWAI